MLQVTTILDNHAIRKYTRLVLHEPESYYSNAWPDGHLQLGWVTEQIVAQINQIDSMILRPF